MTNPKPIGYVQMQSREEMGLWKRPGGSNSLEFQWLFARLQQSLARLRHERDRASIVVRLEAVRIDGQECRSIRLSPPLRADSAHGGS